MGPKVRRWGSKEYTIQQIVLLAAHLGHVSLYEIEGKVLVFV
jgi:hypothetical protein